MDANRIARPRARRVQQREIAERAGVSPSTVSRVLNNRSGISADVQRLVRETALDLGYVPAAEPAGQIRRISLLTRLAPHGRTLDPFHSGILLGIEAECRRQGISLNFRVLEDAADTAVLLDQLRQPEADGVLLLSVDDDALVREALARELRLVVINADYPELPVDIIRPDRYYGVRCAIRMLIRRGHRRIAHLTSLRCQTFFRHMEAYRAALAEAAIPFDPRLMIDCSLNPETAYDACRSLLAAGPPDFTAIFAANDLAALGVIRALQEVGLRVPDDVSIVGCDDIPIAAFVSPPLTTIRIEREELGALAVRRLLDRAAFPHQTPLLIEMSTRLIERQSVADV